jgi:hypothetical protein
LKHSVTDAVAINDDAIRQEVVDLEEVLEGVYHAPSESVDDLLSLLRLQMKDARRSQLGCV